MKQVLLALLALPILSVAQETSKTMNFDDVDRTYIEYIPSVYDGSTAVPLLISLHGLGDNMNNFKNVGFQQLAEIEDFIVITPQALVDNLTNSSAWNSGAGAFGITLNADVNDVGFIRALIDEASTLYNIDQAKIYATGFSMGGFMSNRLACELNWRVSAIASVAGTIGSGITCEPGRAVPAAHFHGTADETVSYSGNLYGNDAEALLDFWKTNNTCTAAVDTLDFEDTVPGDSIAVVRYHFTDCANGAEIMFYKAIGAAHEWLFKPNNDISYTDKIWEFLSAQTHPNPSSVSISESSIPELAITLFPNPASEKVQINLAENQAFTVALYDNKGVLLLNETATQNLEISIANLPVGVYHVKVETTTGIAVKRLVKE
ncbi:MAG: polyhydroxybutyrate depolymerase [Flavobacteriales bacterium]|jgi:polyhydroxybutyrate depolymerase